MSEQDNYLVAQKIVHILYSMLGGSKQSSHNDVLEKTKQLMSIFPETSKLEPLNEKYNLILNLSTDLYEKEIGIKTYDPYVIAKNKKSNIWFYKKKETIPHPYFDRYRAYLEDDGFSPKAVDGIEQICEKILSYCADPECATEDKKLGLVVGDVQSGKTANYLALINMAYDYGYRVVVLLAGLTESLRVQTQRRVDEGIIGAKSDSIGNQIEYIGVDKGKKDHYAIPFTNQENDFSNYIQRNLNAKIYDFKKPVVLVVKKNKKILESVLNQLKPVLGDDRANSVLIIDDEADNASINTAKPDRDPTAINRGIRKIFNSYPIASYVGFTATPFANVLMNPDSDEDNLDLFPSDFIVQLNAPSNYFGGRKIFNGEEKLARPIRIISECEPHALPLVHKKEDKFEVLSDSLKEAIQVFIINNVIRTLRGQTNKHRSMLVNISRFNNLHFQIKERIEDYVLRLKNVIEQDSKYPVERFIKNVEINKMYNLFQNDPFFNEVRNGNKNNKIIPISWQDIQNGLVDEIEKIETVIVNSKYSFDYANYSEGVRVIVVGGFVLSRGLTLEGLMVSYYNRNAMAYDTLLQMCRWFGYRPNYEDLCRVYISQNNVDNFNAVLDAVENLKDQFSEMDRQDKKPKDFGLMVKESPETLSTLLVTSRNKQYYSENIEYQLHYGGVYADTSKIYKEPNFNKQNIVAFEKFYKKHQFTKIDGRYMVRNVSNDDIAAFVSELKIPYVNRKFDIDGLSEYIKNSDVYTNWDVVIATGDSKEINFMGNPELKCSERSFHYEPEEKYIRIGGKNNRVLDPNIFNSGLNITADEKAKLVNEGKKNLTALDYLNRRENPILVIYPLDLKTEPSEGKDDGEGKEAIKESYGKKQPVLAFAIGFPNKDSNVKLIYRMNKVKKIELEKEMTWDEDEEEFDE